MTKLSGYFWLSVIVITSGMALAQPAISCSRGPGPEEMTDAQRAEAIRAITKNYSLIFEMTVTTLLQGTPRRQQCNDMMTKKHDELCGENGSESACRDLADQFLELCQWERAVKFDLGKVWKGKINETSAIAHFKYGGFHRQLPDGGGSCVGTLDLRVGDHLTFCGSIDSGGVLQGEECFSGPDLTKILEDSID